MRNPSQNFNLSLLVSFSWILVKEHNYNKSEAFKLAWKVIKLKKSMSKGNVEFSFVKKDGSIRKVIGTTNIENMPKDASTFKGGHEHTIMQIRFYDVENKGWRSCVASNLI